MKSPSYKERYSHDDFSLLGFHDCHVRGIHWSASDFSLSLTLDYIIQWVRAEDVFHFWVSPAELCFHDISDVKIELDWKGTLDCQMQDITKANARKTPNGAVQHLWEIDFFSPDGQMELWAIGFQLTIKEPPKLVRSPRL